MIAVVLLIALRVTVGWHFFYEGAWKIANQDQFSAEPFLTMAKGPASGLFYAMVPDLNGRERLAMTPGLDGQPGVISGQVYVDAWGGYKTRFENKFKLDDAQKKKVEGLHKQYLASLGEYLEVNQEEIVQHFGSLDRFEEHKKSPNLGAAHQKERLWEEQMKLRSEANAWLSELEGMGVEYQAALRGQLTSEQKAKGKVAPVVLAPNKLPVPLPFVHSFSQLIDMAVTYGLTAIGLCLMLGFCNRLACLGGGAFLFSVLLTQPPWPTIYPHAPAIVGHAMIVDKNFVEMVAILALAALPVGRWGGLDYFLHHWIGRRVLSYFNKKV